VGSIPIGHPKPRRRFWRRFAHNGRHFGLTLEAPAVPVSVPERAPECPVVPVKRGKDRAKTTVTAERTTRAPRPPRARPSWAPRDRSEETPQVRRHLARVMAPLVKAERQGLIYLDVLTEAREPLTPEARAWAVNKLRVRLQQGFAGRREGAYTTLGGIVHRYLMAIAGPRSITYWPFSTSRPTHMAPSSR
jgi:hypothetical protein